MVATAEPNVGVLSEQGNPVVREPWEVAAQVLLWIWVGKWAGLRLSRRVIHSSPTVFPGQWLGNSPHKCKCTKEGIYNR